MHPSNALDDRDGAELTSREVGGCVALRTLFRSPLAVVTSWQCLRDSEWLSRERHHDWPVLGLIESGACVVERDCGKALAESASLVLHEPRVPYRTAHPFGCGDRGVNVAVHPRIAREVRTAFDPDGSERAIWPTHSLSSPPRARLRFFLLLRRLSAGLPVAAIDVEESVIGLTEGVLAMHYRPAQGAAPVRRGTRDAHQDLVERCKSVLFARLDERLPLARIAAEVGASEFHLARLFRQATGLTLGRYQNRLRLAIALGRAAEHRGSLTELGLSLGFSSHSHFSAAFRREFGVSPKAVARFAGS